MATGRILEIPICYSTHVTKGKLLKCSCCKCAWYINKSEQQAHWPSHQKVCKRPDYEMVQVLSKSQCYKLLKDTFSYPEKISHNTAAILEHLYNCIRSDNDRFDETPQDLHKLSRMSSLTATSDFYKKMWAVPGMPQFLYFTDLRSVTYREVMEKYPQGRPQFKDGDEAFVYDMTYNFDMDESGEQLAWFVIAFLIQSSVFSEVSPSFTTDGIGQLRTSKSAQAARNRITEIFSSDILRSNAKKALYPVPGFIYNIAKNLPDDFYRYLDKGVFSGIIEWADNCYAFDTLKLICTLDLTQLSQETKLDIIIICCDAFIHPPWDSRSDPEVDVPRLEACSTIAGKILINCQDYMAMLLEGINWRKELTILDWERATATRAAERMALAYLHGSLVDSGDQLTVEVLHSLLLQWKKVEICDKVDFAREVMDTDTYEYWMKMTESARNFTEKQKMMKAGKLEASSGA